MAPFYLAILSWFPRINEIVDNVLLLTQEIKRVEFRMQRIAAFVIPCISVSEITPIIRLDGSHPERSPCKYLS